MVALRVEELAYAYPDGTEALRGVSFAVEEGQRLAILGANGCGKTTLLRCLNGLLTPTAGRVEVLSRRVERASLDWVRARLQLVFQSPDDQLFAPTVEEDVAFGPRNLGLEEEAVRERVAEALAALGLEALRGRNPSLLSGGQKRLAAIAGVVAMRPTVIALDEPTSDLDERSSRDILRVLEAFHDEGKTILLATHNVELAARWADEIVLLAEGRVVARGPPGDVFYEVEDLEGLGVRIPPVVRLFRMLAKEGLVNPAKRPMRPEELLEALLVAVERA